MPLINTTEKLKGREAEICAPFRQKSENQGPWITVCFPRLALPFCEATDEKNSELRKNIKSIYTPERRGRC